VSSPHPHEVNNFDTPARTQHFRFGFDLPDLVLSAERVSSALGGRGRRRPFYLYVRCAAGVLNNNGGGGGIWKNYIIIHQRRCHIGRLSRDIIFLLIQSPPPPHQRSRLYFDMKFIGALNSDARTLDAQNAVQRQDVDRTAARRRRAIMLWQWVGAYRFKCQNCYALKVCSVQIKIEDQYSCIWYALLCANTYAIV